MILKYDKLMNCKKDLEHVDRTDPNNVVGALVHTLCNYNPDDTENFYRMLGYLMGDYQEISNLLKQQIKDRMIAGDKYLYIGKSYFDGATPKNNYQPKINPYIINVIEHAHIRLEKGFVKLFLKSGGADNERSVTLREAKDGNFYVWSDSFLGLLSNIRIKESENPWV